MDNNQSQFLSSKSVNLKQLTKLIENIVNRLLKKTQFPNEWIAIVDSINGNGTVNVRLIGETNVIPNLLNKTGRKLEVNDEVWIHSPNNDLSNVEIRSVKHKTTSGDGSEITGTIDGNNVNIANINANNINAGNIQTDRLKANVVEAVNAYIGTAKIDGAIIDHATITNAHISDLESDRITADKIDTGSIASDVAFLDNLVVGSSQIANSSITNAMIVEMTGDKIVGNTIDTSKVSIQGTNGKLRMANNRIQVFDNQSTPKERVSIGDVNADGSVYGMRIRGADGTTLLMDENGVKKEGITDGSIDNSKISTTADINGSKLLNNSVGGSKIVADSITAREIASRTITANEIVAGTITGNEIDVHTINAGHIVAGSITTNELASNIGASLDISSNQSVNIAVKSSVDAIQIGGRNFLRNSGNFKDLSYWNSNGGAILSLDSVVQYCGQNTMKVVGTSGLYQESILLKPNTEYVYSVVVRSTISNVVGSEDTPLHIQVWTDENPTSIHQEIYTGDFDTTILYNSWKKCYRRFKTPNSSNFCHFRAYLYSIGNNPINIATFQLEEGSKATSWTPAPEDFQTQVDNIQIGGRNLLLKSNRSGYLYDFASNSKSGYGVKFLTGQNYVPSSYLNLKLLQNQIYTISFVAWCEGTSSVLHNDLLPDNLPEKVFNLTTTPTLYTWSLSSNQAEMTNCSMRFFGEINSNTYITDIKLEIGNKNTDWTPPPEDIISQINVSPESITIQANKIGLLGETNIPNLHFDKMVGGTAIFGGVNNGNGSLIIKNASGNTVIQADKDSTGKYNIRALDSGGTPRAIFGEYESGKYGLGVYNQIGDLITSSDTVPIKYTSGYGVKGCYLSTNTAVDGIVTGSSAYNTSLNYGRIYAVDTSTTFPTFIKITANDGTLMSLSNPVGKVIYFTCKSTIGSTTDVNAVVLHGTITSTSVSGAITTITCSGGFFKKGYSGSAYVNKLTIDTNCNQVLLEQPQSKLLNVSMSGGYIIDSNQRYITVSPQTKMNVDFSADLLSGTTIDGNTNEFYWLVFYLDSNATLQYNKIAAIQTGIKPISLGTFDVSNSNAWYIEVTQVPDLSSIPSNAIIVGSYLCGFPSNSPIPNTEMCYLAYLVGDPMVRKQLPFYIGSSNTLCSSNVTSVSYQVSSTLAAKACMNIRFAIGENVNIANFCIGSNETSTSTYGCIGSVGRKKFNGSSNFSALSPTKIFSGYRYAAYTGMLSLTDTSAANGVWCILDAWVDDSTTGKQMLNMVFYNPSTSSTTNSIIISVNAY